MIQELVDILLDGMQHAIGFLRAVELSPGINLWTITMCAFILAVIIKGLINVVSVGLLSAAPRSASRSGAQTKKKSSGSKKGG